MTQTTNQNETNADEVGLLNEKYAVNNSKSDNQRWTEELLQRKLRNVSRAYGLFIAQPSPANGDYVTDCMKEYADVWCQHKAD